MKRSTANTTGTPKGRKGFAEYCEAASHTSYKQGKRAPTPAQAVAWDRYIDSRLKQFGTR